jgi:predicted transposase/invertase (TIGR01784 family)
MGKYLDPRADLTFKKIFGEHKHLVISLLNALLPLKDDERVESIEYWPAEKIPERMQAEKDSIVDVCCKDNKNREFIVEMQMTWTDSFKKRVLLNASKAYVAQSKKGDEFALLQPVYALNFVNAEFMKDVDDYYHYYHLVHDKYTNKVIDGLHLVFVELPKFKPQSFSERKMQVLWLRFLTEINDETREVPAELLENAEVNEALEIIERAAFSDAEMRAYDKFWDNVSVQKTLDNARKREINEAKREVAEAKREVVEAKREVVEAKREVVEAKREAERTIAEAKAEVAEAKAEVAEAKAKVEVKLKQKDIDTARKLKELSLPFEQIAEITGLTLEQIEAL